MAATVDEAATEPQTSSKTESTKDTDQTQSNEIDSTHDQQKTTDKSRGASTRGRGKFTRRHGNRSNYESLAESNDAEEIRRQVEFYFSDSNLPVDAYLLKLSGGPENKPIPLKTIHDFKRMRHFQPFSAVRDAVSASDLLDLNDDNEITRKTPLDARYTLDVSDNKKIAQEISLPRSVYAKGFGFEKSTTQLDIETYFEPFGPVNSVRMRRHADGNFKGSAFVEFANEQLAKQFLDLDIHPAFSEAKNKGTTGDEKEQDAKTEPANGKKSESKLQVMSKQAYLETKGRDLDDEAERPTHRKQTGAGRGGKNGRGRGHGRGGRGGRENIGQDDWKKRREQDQSSSRKPRSEHRREYRDVNAEDDGDDIGSVALPEDNTVATKKRSREEEEAGESDAPAKKAKADEPEAEAEGS